MASRQPEEWMSPAEAGAFLGVRPETLRLMDDDGVLHASRLPSGHRRYPAAEIAALKALRDAGGSGG